MSANYPSVSRSASWRRGRETHLGLLSNQRRPKSIAVLTSVLWKKSSSYPKDFEIISKVIRTTRSQNSLAFESRLIEVNADMVSRGKLTLYCVLDVEFLSIRAWHILRYPHRPWSIVCGIFRAKKEVSDVEIHTADEQLSSVHSLRWGLSVRSLWPHWKFHYNKRVSAFWLMGLISKTNLSEAAKTPDSRSRQPFHAKRTCASRTCSNSGRSVSSQFQQSIPLSRMFRSAESMGMATEW